MRQYEYKDGRVGGTGGDKTYMTEAAMDAAVQVAAAKKAEIKGMSQSQMLAAWNSGERTGCLRMVVQGQSRQGAHQECGSLELASAAERP